MKNHQKFKLMLLTALSILGSHPDAIMAKELNSSRIKEKLPLQKLPKLSRNQKIGLGVTTAGVITIGGLAIGLSIYKKKSNAEKPSSNEDKKHEQITAGIKLDEKHNPIKAGMKSDGMINEEKSKSDNQIQKYLQVQEQENKVIIEKEKKDKELKEENKRKAEEKFKKITGEDVKDLLGFNITLKAAYKKPEDSESSKILNTFIKNYNDVNQTNCTFYGTRYDYTIYIKSLEMKKSKDSYGLSSAPLKFEGKANYKNSSSYGAEGDVKVFGLNRNIWLVVFKGETKSYDQMNVEGYMIIPDNVICQRLKL